MSLSPEPASPTEVLDQAQSVLFGRFMLPDTTEHPCQVSHLTPDGAVFLTASVPSSGLPLVVYIADVGRVEALSGDPVDGGFKVDFQLSPTRRDRFIEKLKALLEPEGAEQRRHARFQPRDTQSHLTMPDGRNYACEVIDISLSGAAVKVDVMPALGTYLHLGKMRGRVVRYHEGGVAIEFTRQLDKTTLDEQVG